MPNAKPKQTKPLSKTKREILAVKQAQAALAALHPELFSLADPRPFKVGFRADLTQRYPDISHRVLSGLMGWLTVRRAYLASCRIGAARWGFEGRCGEVSAKEADYADAMWLKRNARARDPWPDRLTPPEPVQQAA